MHSCNTHLTYLVFILAGLLFAIGCEGNQADTEQKPSESNAQTQRERPSETEDREHKHLKRIVAEWYFVGNNPIVHKHPVEGLLRTNQIQGPEKVEIDSASPVPSTSEGKRSLIFTAEEAGNSFTTEYFGHFSDGKKFLYSLQFGFDEQTKRRYDAEIQFAGASSEHRLSVQKKYADSYNTLVLSIRPKDFLDRRYGIYRVKINDENLVLSLANDYQSLDSMTVTTRKIFGLGISGRYQKSDTPTNQ